MEFRITTFGIEVAATHIEDMGRNAANVRPALEEIYLTILDIEQEAFEKEGARSGFPRWYKLSVATIAWKARKGLSPFILQAYGRLIEAMTTYRSPDVVTRIEKDRIVFTPKLDKIPYARIHQFGGVAGGVEIPMRKYVRFSKEDSAAFGREIAKHILRRRGGPGKIGVSFE